MLIKSVDYKTSNVNLGKFEHIYCHDMNVFNINLDVIRCNKRTSLQFIDFYCLSTLSIEVQKT